MVRWVASVVGKIAVTIVCRTSSSIDCITYVICSICRHPNLTRYSEPSGNWHAVLPHRPPHREEWKAGFSPNIKNCFRNARVGPIDRSVERSPCASVGSTSVLILAADLDVGPNGTIGVYGNGTINAMGHNLIPGDIELGTDGSGQGWSLLDRGAITTGTLGVANGSLALTAADSVTGNLNVGTNGTVTLGSALSLTERST